MKISWFRLKYDFNYIFLNRFVTYIPSWIIRRFFYKYFGMHLEDGARIGIGTIVLNPKGIYIGKRSVINENCYLDGRGILKIGHDTSISAYAKILSASHRLNSENFQYIERRTIVENYVWVGTGAMILEGSKIEDCAVIGAGAVFKGIAEKCKVYVGNPARYIKDRKVKIFHSSEYKSYFR